MNSTLNDYQASVQPESERLARATIDALSSRLCVLDESGRIIATNKAWREFATVPACGCPYQENEGRDGLATSWSMPCWPPETAAVISRTVHKMLAGWRQTFALEYECRTREPVRWFEMRVTRLPGDGPARLVMTHDEITARKSAEAALRKSAERLKELGRHLETVREERRAIFAREIHDGLGAILTMLKLDLAATANQVAPADPLRAKFAGLVDQVAEALKVVKRLSSELRPVTLDTLGLIATVRWYVGEFSLKTGIAMALQLPDYVRISDVAAIAVFRIIQESLTNVAKHSGASQVSISVSKIMNQLVVEITDNGSGIAESDIRREDSFGIIGMHERADYLGGTLSVSSQPAAGTRVTLHIPLDS